MVEKFRIKACFGGKCRIQRGWRICWLAFTIHII
jgi:hypothetical protein